MAYWLSAEQTHLSEYTGVAGILYVATVDTSKRVFFPATGFGDGAIISRGCTYGGCWSSSLNTDSPVIAYRLFFGSSSVNPLGSDDRYYGFPVRPVSD